MLSYRFSDSSGVCQTSVRLHARRKKVKMDAQLSGRLLSILYDHIGISPVPQTTYVARLAEAVQSLYAADGVWGTMLIPQVLCIKL